MKILNLQNANASDIRYDEFTFPDGQPHIKLIGTVPRKGVTIACTLATPLDFIRLAIATDALMHGSSEAPDIAIAYFMGARMDRRIGRREPVSATALGCLMPKHIRRWVDILDPHSDTICEAAHGNALFPMMLYAYALEHVPDALIVCPDDGAVSRAFWAADVAGRELIDVLCSKRRNSKTGALSWFKIDRGEVRGRDLLIVDDIIDGGGTFTGLARVLLDAGAKSVRLCVTHAIFSKGMAIEGVDEIYCTDSFPFADRYIAGGIAYYPSAEHREGIRLNPRS